MLKPHFGYSHETDGFVKRPSDILGSGLKAMENIPRLEKFVVPYLFRTKHVTIPTIGIEDARVQEQKEILEESLQKATPWL